MSARTPDTLRVAAVQLTASGDKDANIATAGRLVEQAAAAGAQLVVLPEKWNLIDNERRQVAGGEPLDGPSLNAARGWAQARGIALVAGSVSEAVPGTDRAYNTSVLIQPDGSVTAIYRKLHLFDVAVGGHTYRESDGAVPGADIVVGRALGHRIGMTVCYDLRFPELFRALTIAGAQILTVPAAFTETTGLAHWEPLLRARAIENQVFVIAAGQIGTHATGTASHGHSMIIDPWGVILAEAADDQTTILADLDFTELERIRRDLPALEHRRADLFDTAPVKQTDPPLGANRLP
jgi:deaminated glutathione amidase